MQTGVYAYIGINKDNLETPALLIDLDGMEFNIKTMMEALSSTLTKIRPHFKTHKCPIISHLQIRAGAIGVTCAKISEAEILVASGIQNILIANQIVQSSKIERLAYLARQSHVIVATDSAENVSNLSEATVSANSILHLLVEVDVGMGRCGVKTQDEINQLVEQILSLDGLHFCGLMGYEGHAVLTQERNTRERTAKEAMKSLTEAAATLRSRGIPVEIVSAGGTGTFDITGLNPGVTEIEAGSYVFMDTEYLKLGLPFRSTLSLLATIIHVSDKGHAVMDAGMKALSTDNGLPYIVSPRGVSLIELNEEHGILKCDGAAKLRVGDKIELVPSHVCTTVNLHNSYFAMRGEHLEAIWSISGRGMIF